MSNKFDTRAAGVQKAPSVCKSKTTEQLSLGIPIGQSITIAMSIDADPFYGRQAFDFAILLRRSSLTANFQGQAETPLGYEISILVTASTWETDLQIQIGITTFPAGVPAPNPPLKAFCGPQPVGVKLYLNQQPLYDPSSVMQGDADFWIS